MTWQSTQHLGFDLAYRQEGTGSPLLLFDGIACDGYAWRYLWDELSKNFRVIHPNYRGHGRSTLPVGSDKARLDELASDQWQVMDALGIHEPTILCAHSMGVQVALECYRQQPKRVKAMVLMCGVAGKLTYQFGGSDILANMLPGLIKVAKAKPGLVQTIYGLLPPKLAYPVGKYMRWFDPDAMPEEDFASYWNHAMTLDPVFFLHVLKAAGDHNAYDMLDSINVPTFILAAEHDDFVQDYLVKDMSEKIATSEFHLLASASHAAPVEQSAHILTLLASFWDKHHLLKAHT